MRRGRVRGDLIDAARGLCARQGVGATSIRRVIEASGANLNAVHYHFGSREGLIDALVDEAQEALNKERFELFDALIESGFNEKSGPRVVLEAGYGPLFRQALGPDRDQYRDGLLVLAQLRNDPGPDGARSMERHAVDFLERFEPLLKRVVPSSPRLFRDGMRLVNSAAWDFALRCDVHETVAQSASQTRTANQLLKRYLDFATAGLEGLFGR